jgi:hypothetical protein
MDFVQVAHGSRLGHVLPYAIIERAINKEIGAGALGATLLVE